jgi:DNA-binding LacI/PurR family transcriptional regulator
MNGGGHDMRVTIKDVAKLANVAPSTVSRVIADSPRISERTKVKVREAMEQLGYHPNLNARSLANKSTQALGIVMPSATGKVLQNPFFPEVIRGISAKAYEEEYALYLTTGQTEEEIFEDVVKMVQGNRVDGIVLLYSRVDDQIMHYLYEKQFPFVVIGKPYKYTDEIHHVDNDNVKAALEVTDYLISLGHERIGFIAGTLDLVVTIDRLQGYERAMRLANLPYRNEYTIFQEFVQESGKNAVKKYLSLKEFPTALIVTDDIMALGVLAALHEMGIRVPQDVSVISFNNLMIADYTQPALSSVEVNIFDLGYEAANCLLQAIHHPQIAAKQITVNHEMILRQSCAPLQKND